MTLERLMELATAEITRVTASMTAGLEAVNTADFRQLADDMDRAAQAAGNLQTHLRSAAHIARQL